ncbi:MAG: N-acetylmuramoyl-L-alanine amidase [Rhodothermales bacterium]|nr:N-acetylmuramoyl-L-alanine amidase [Rhodothermales bacterium]MBO6781485.1 N-acetylmuramoyl-L-alanine amidase [Rhodothermales bacterium]
MKAPVFCLLLALVGTVSAQDRPMVAIDAGHGGEVAGVVVGERLEKDVVLEMAFVVAAEFVAAGYDVVFTRTTDVDVPWPRRRSIAEEAGADFLVMLHANRNDDPAVNGAEVYANTEQAHQKAFAGMVAEKLTTVGKAELMHRPWPFLQSETVATAMIEVAFMSNPEDARKLESRDFQRAVGQAMVDAAEFVREHGEH